ncbi:MAG TPA: 30S ribosomal protein S1 [Candidatus Sulfotelmatobacter sp.]|nr:30S ribosomal protein S1 [Candidatus Sulfotelmatobacter sp.]
MSNPNAPEPAAAQESAESFGNILSQFERSKTTKRAEGSREGTVVSVSAESVFLDIGFKTEGMLPLTEFQNDREPPKRGDKLQVSIKGRDPEGYYLLTRSKVARPTDWAALERAFAEKTPIIGTVTAVVKGGLSVDVGVRAFMPASRSGARDASEMEKLVEQEIRCRIIKLDATDEDVVVDRRAVAEDEELANKQRRYSEMKEGDVVSGTVRSLTDYGAFVDIGGADALLHVGDISWGRINKAADVLTVGQLIEAKILKIDAEKRRVSVGTKQLQPHPWDAVSGKYKVGERVRGAVTRVTDFGAFVELEPGVEGLIHVSEMSWVKKVRKPSDLVKPGETVEAVILGINLGERRMSLGLKQALGDPWADAAQKFRVGSVVEGPVMSLTKFGAFVQVAEGIEGMIHVSDISEEKRINHPQDVLRVGQTVKAQVLEIDTEKRRLKLGMKQLVPTSIDEYIAEHKEGDVVSGRVIDVSGASARVELGEGIQADCRISSENKREDSDKSVPQGGKTDLSSLSSMLQARWKSGAVAQTSKPQDVQAGQVRSFRIRKLDREAKKIEVEVA